MIIICKIELAAVQSVVIWWMKIFTSRNYVLIKQQQLFTGLHKMNIQFHGVLFGELKLMVIEHPWGFFLNFTTDKQFRAQSIFVDSKVLSFSAVSPVVIQMRFGAFNYKLRVYSTWTETIDNGKISLDFLFLSRIILKLKKEKPVYFF